MPADLLVRSRSVLTPGGLVEADVVIEGSTIAAVAPLGSGGPARRTLLVDSLAVIPGAVDPHVHFDEPGRSDWEGWASGSLAAVAGGVTTVVDMPIDSDPPTVDEAQVRAKREAASRSSLVDFALWGGVVPGNGAALEPMVEAGVIGFKAFLCDSGWATFPPADEAALDQALATVARHDLVLAAHCEDEGHLGSGPVSPDTRPVEAEVAAVRRLGTMAEPHRARTHAVHLSAAAAVTQARRFSAMTTETCPHYLNLDHGSGSDPWAVVTPPLRGADNCEALWAHVAGGAIDCIASDHSPCPPAAKEGPRPFAGIAGIETALSVLLDAGRLSLEAISALRVAAATILGLESKGSIAVGMDADLALVDLEARWVPGPTTLHSRHRRTPWNGRLLPGRVITTIVGGRVVYDAGEQVASPAGRFLRPGGDRQ